MKLERVLRKAVPFLLIAILIACLFSKPQREGYKGEHWMVKDHNKNGVHVALGTAGAIMTGKSMGWIYDIYAEDAKLKAKAKANPATNVMDHTSNDISSNAATISKVSNVADEAGKVET